MPIQKPIVTFFFAIVCVAGCKHQAQTAANSSDVSVAPASNASQTHASDQRHDNPSSTSQVPIAEQRQADPSVVSTSVKYDAPPSVGAGLSVDQAYAAIPHRRTVWIADESTVPSEEKAYLKAIFPVVDQAVAIRVAGLQNFSNRQFDSANVAADFDQLITFVRAMPVPNALTAYHQDILAALSGEREFFDEWRSQRDQFGFAQQIGNHPGVRAASAASRAAYNELMTKYPRESQTNKDAFFDYHCALDFL
jgi:hypothetical protein